MRKASTEWSVPPVWLAYRDTRMHGRRDSGNVRLMREGHAAVPRALSDAILVKG